jgi:hypothetical protein
VVRILRENQSDKNMSDGALMSDDLGMPLLAANLLTKVDIAAKRYKKHKNKI